MFSWYKYLIVSLVFSHLGFWSGNLFLIAPFPDLCLLEPFSMVITGPDSVMVRAFASEAGGASSNPGRVIPKTLKMVPVATLLGAQH